MSSDPIEAPDPDLRIESVTGVDVTLPIAGLGGRSYAFIIDWHIRLIGGLAWFFVAQWIAKRSFNVRTQDTAFDLWVVLPAFVIYFLYHPVLEIVMGGRTPGKRMAGVRIVMRDGSPPGVGPLLIRNVFRLLDSLPFVYVVGLISCFATRQQVRVGDLAAGTLLVYDETPARESVTRLVTQGTAAGLTAAQTEFIDDLVARWPALDPVVRMNLARQALLQFESAAPPVSIATLSEAQTLERLKALLRPAPASAQ